MLCLAFSYVKAQNILVNSNVISVNEDVTFPFWLDSMSTIEIGAQVVSISALEFNIVPANNGNSLVFSQIKTITSQETVPNGMTWKITAVLLDSTAINNSSSNGSNSTSVSGGGNTAVALSEESLSAMNMGDAMIYCDSLQEDGYDNWVVPTWKELWFVSGGGGIVPGTRTDNALITTKIVEGNSEYLCVDLLYGEVLNSVALSANYLRCVRHESVALSGGSPGGSNTASSLGSGMPTMISNESANTISWGEAIVYCDVLNESGFSDWIMPSSDQLTYAISGGCTIQDPRTSQQIWTRTLSPQDDNMCITIMLNLPVLGDGSEQTNSVYTGNDFSLYKSKCRCVR